MGQADILELIVSYLKHHKGTVPQEIAKPIRSVKMEKIVEDEWDAKFINGLSKKVVFQIILGANYMDIKSLLHLGCAKIATLIKGKSPEEIKKILSEEDDVPEEKMMRLFIFSQRPSNLELTSNNIKLFFVWEK